MRCSLCESRTSERTSGGEEPTDATTNWPDRRGGCAQNNGRRGEPLGRCLCVVGVSQLQLAAPLRTDAYCCCCWAGCWRLLLAGLARWLCLPVVRRRPCSADRGACAWQTSIFISRTSERTRGALCVLICFARLAAAPPRLTTAPHSPPLSCGRSSF